MPTRSQSICLGSALAISLASARGGTPTQSPTSAGNPAAPHGPGDGLTLDEAIQSVPGLNLIATYGLAFFDVYVTGDAASEALLEAGHPGLDVYEESSPP